MGLLKNPTWFLVSIIFLPTLGFSQETKLLDNVLIKWRCDLEVTKNYYNKIGKELPEQLAKDVLGITFTFNKDQTFVFVNPNLKIKRTGRFVVKKTEEKNNELTFAFSYEEGLPANSLKLKIDELGKQKILVITAEDMDLPLVLIESTKK